MGRGRAIFGAQGLKIGDFVKKKEPSLDTCVACQSKNFLTRKIIFPHLKDYGKLPDWWHPAF